MKSLILAIAASGLLLSAVEAVAAEAPPLQQTPIELNAADVVPGGKLEGIAYKIEPGVQNDGFVNAYTLQTGEMPTSLDATNSNIALVSSHSTNEGGCYAFTCFSSS